jgi:hypothetical protein
MTGSPVGGTGYDDWVNTIWVLLLPFVLVVATIAAVVDRWRK